MDDPINYFESTNKVDHVMENIAQGLYQEITEFYMFLIESIEPDDYERMKEHLGYTESYEEHINSLTEGVPSRETTLNQIKEFLTIYREFIDEEYITVLKQLNSRIQMNRELCKIQAYQILQQQSEQFKQGEEKRSQRGGTQSKIETIIGGKFMSFNTYNNPLLVSLYSLLLVWFSLKKYGEPPTPVIYNEDEINV